MSSIRYSVVPAFDTYTTSYFDSCESGKIFEEFPGIIERQNKDKGRKYFAHKNKESIFEPIRIGAKNYTESAEFTIAAISGFLLDKFKIKIDQKINFYDYKNIIPGNHRKYNRIVFGIVDTGVEFSFTELKDRFYKEDFSESLDLSSSISNRDLLDKDGREKYFSRFLFYMMMTSQNIENMLNAYQKTFDNVTQKDEDEKAESYRNFAKMNPKDLLKNGGDGPITISDRQNPFYIGDKHFRAGLKGMIDTNYSSIVHMIRLYKSDLRRRIYKEVFDGKNLEIQNLLPIVANGQPLDETLVPIFGQIFSRIKAATNILLKVETNDELTTQLQIVKNGTINDSPVPSDSSVSTDSPVPSDSSDSSDSTGSTVSPDSPVNIVVPETDSNMNKFIKGIIYLAKTIRTSPITILETLIKQSGDACKTSILYDFDFEKSTTLGRKISKTYKRAQKIAVAATGVGAILIPLYNRLIQIGVYRNQKMEIKTFLKLLNSDNFEEQMISRNYLQLKIKLQKLFEFLYFCFLCGENMIVEVLNTIFNIGFKTVSTIGSIFSRKTTGGKRMGRVKTQKRKILNKSLKNKKLIKGGGQDGGVMVLIFTLGMCA